MRRRSNSGRLMIGSEGSIAIVFALALTALLGVASLAVDIGQIVTVRSELQNTADAATMAAARALIQEYTDASNHKVVYRDAQKAHDAAIALIQAAATNQGRTWDANGYAISLAFARYDDHAIESPTTKKWNPLLDANDMPVDYTLVPSTSDVNAVQVTVKRAHGKTYGPVTNLFASTFGKGTTEVSASAQAYMGYVASTYTGTVQVPLALPSTGALSPLASKGDSGGWGRMFGPAEAMATAPTDLTSTAKTIVFRDSGAYYDPANPGTGPTNVSTTVPAGDFNNLDSRQLYLFTVGSSDNIPATITDILKKIYTPTYTTSSNPVVVGKLALGQRIYPRSEFNYGVPYMSNIFQGLQKAYYYQTTGNASTAPTADTPWRVTLPVYGLGHNPLNPAWTSLGTRFGYLARLLGPWPTEALACAKITAPVIYVNGFVNADIIGVTSNSSADNGTSYTYPTTSKSNPKPTGTPIPSTSSIYYANKRDFLARNSNSTWNTNTMTITNVKDVSTIIPGTSTAHATYGNTGGEGGGLSAKEMDNRAPSKVGAFASIPKMIK